MGAELWQTNKSEEIVLSELTKKLPKSVKSQTKGFILQIFLSGAVPDTGFLERGS